MSLSGKKILMVIAPTNFKDEEYFIPKEIFKEQGATVTTTSTIAEPISVAGETAKSNLVLKDATQDYDAIVFVGGPGANVYFDDETAQNLAKKFFENGKVVAAICIAPSTLANAGLLKGKKATAYPSEKDNLEAKGAIYTGESVTQDGKIITGKDPAAAKEFAQKISTEL